MATGALVGVRGCTMGSPPREQEKEYAFGVAVFDNAQVRHAYSPGVLKMKFE